MEAIKNLFSALGGQVQVIILLSVNFIILILILNKFLFKRVLTHLDNRKKEIEDTFGKIEQDKKHITQMTDEYQAKLSQIEKEAYQKIQSAVKEGLTAKTDIISEAHLQADNVLRKAKDEIGLEKNKAMKEMRQEIITLAISAAEKIISKELDEKTNSRVVSEFLEEIDRNK
ncbi:MAG: F0F1 ATP synthase subunit B [Planctomycetes bacterium]|nr:F0F1 ATP synthase subunit B [Planctomycetota bacterium]